MAVSASSVYGVAARTQQPPALPAQNTAARSLTTSPAMAPVVTEGDASQMSAGPYTPTAMSRWSILNHKLPEANAITSIHVYDFDNTLFKTPLPNAKLWNASTVGSLSSQDVFATGGWWHDVRILSATGEGLEKEEPRAWEGWWNEQVAELVRLSGKEPGALCVLLTGRAERGFSDLIQRMVNSKGLKFDLITLKPAAGPGNEQFASTMAFKQAFLETLMETYHGAASIRIYEDRPRHVTGFREFLNSYNERRQGRREAPLPPIAGEVVPVEETATVLDPVVEVAEVLHMVNCHNALGGGQRGPLALTKTVFFTGYLITDADKERLLGLLNLPAQISQRDLKYHGNSIMINPRSCPPNILAKAGGLGYKMRWRVEAIGNLNNNLWAVKVQPATPNATYHTAEPVPLVVLAVYRGARPYEASRIRTWQPIAADKVFEFETTVGEKAILRVESQRTGPSSENNNNSGSRENDGPQSGNGPPGKRKRVGPAPYNNGPGFANKPRPHNATGGPIPTQPAGFAPPRGPSGGAQYGGAPGGGRGYHAQSGGRGNRGGGGGGGGGNFRGQGFAGGRGNYRGGAAMRGGGRGGGANHAVAGGGFAVTPGNKTAGRGQGYYKYQSLDDAGPPQTQVPQRQQVVYDDDAM